MATSLHYACKAASSMRCDVTLCAFLVLCRWSCCCIPHATDQHRCAGSTCGSVPFECWYCPRTAALSHIIGVFWTTADAAASTKSRCNNGARRGAPVQQADGSTAGLCPRSKLARTFSLLQVIIFLHSLDSKLLPTLLMGADLNSVNAPCPIILPMAYSSAKARDLLHPAQARASVSACSI